MKLMTKTLIALSCLWFLTTEALQAGAPSWVIACSATARAVAQASFGRQPMFMGLLSDIFRDQPAGNGLQYVFVNILDAKAGNGKPICNARACVDQVRAKVNEIVLSNTPMNPPNRPYTDLDFKIFASDAALGLHAIRNPDAGSQVTVQSAQMVSNGWDRLTYVVSISGGGFGSSAQYRVELLKNREFPVDKVAFSGGWEMSPSSDPVVQLLAGVTARNTAMASFSRQPIVRNFATNFKGQRSGWGDARVEMEVLDAKAGSGVPVGLASVLINSSSGAVTRVEFSPAMTNPPLRPYSDVDFKIFASDAALAVYSVRRPDAGMKVSVNRANQISNSWGSVVYRVEILDGESGQTQYIDVEMKTDREFPVSTIAVATP